MRRVVFASMVVVAVIYVVVMRGTDHGSTTDTPSTQEPTPSVSHTADPVELKDSKKNADRTVKRFIHAYYSRSEALLAGNYEQREERFRELLQPFVTDRFIDLYAYPLNSPLDDELAERDGTVSAVARLGPGHMHDDVIDKEVNVQFQVKWPGYKTETSELSVVVFLALSDDVWRVESIQEVAR